MCRQFHFMEIYCDNVKRGEFSHFSENLNSNTKNSETQHESSLVSRRIFHFMLKAVAVMKFDICRAIHIINSSASQEYCTEATAAKAAERRLSYSMIVMLCTPRVLSSLWLKPCEFRNHDDNRLNVNGKGIMFNECKSIFASVHWNKLKIIIFNELNGILNCLFVYRFSNVSVTLFVSEPFGRFDLILISLWALCTHTCIDFPFCIVSRLICQHHRR